MAFNSYEELMAAVEARNTSTLTLEVPIAAVFSPEHEAAKTALKQAEGMKALTGGVNFLGGDQIEELKLQVEKTRPEEPTVWLRFKRLGLGPWSLLIKKTGLTALDQYESVLQDTFVGVWGQDPDGGEEGEVIEPLSNDPRLVSSKGDIGILPGGALNSVVQTFINWQNSGGEVTIRPTKSGRA